MIKKVLFYILAATAVLTSCAQDDTLRYNNITMGNVTRGLFTSDQGNVFHVVEKNCTGNLETMNRALILCDVLEQVPGKENEYNIRLNALAEVLVKDYITLEQAASNPSTLVDDPILIEDMWISGGYINMYVAFEIKSADYEKHMVNLVLDEAASSAGKYVFQLRHNSFGESLVYNPSDTGMIIAANYVSFPISDLVKEDSAQIQINWKWYKSAGQGWSSETQNNSYTLSYTKGGHEQAPAVYSQKTKGEIN